MTLWKINCMEDGYPGMWHRWYRHQCVAVGWYAKWGYRLEGPAKDDQGWARARSALQRIAVGDQVVVALRGHRVGRIGQVTGKLIGDEHWDPLVPRTKRDPDGEMGRRVLVRWDMTAGPDSRDQVVLLPDGLRFTAGELRPTIAEIRSISIKDVRDAMNDRTNWIGLLSHFPYEKALSDFIAAYPHRLEDGLVLHPSEKIRERVFDDRTRLDVLLIDREERPVIVECKQHSPTVADLGQLRHYLKLLKKETEQEPRGILVHGGATKLRTDVVTTAAGTKKGTKKGDILLFWGVLSIIIRACRELHGPRVGAMFTTSSIAEMGG